MWYAWVLETIKLKLGFVNNNSDAEKRLSTSTFTLIALSL